MRHVGDLHQLSSYILEAPIYMALLLPRAGRLAMMYEYRMQEIECDISGGG